MGCEKTRLGRVQICLLLSYRKTYLPPVFESEYFLLEAHRLLEEANVPAILSDTSSFTPELNMWSRLYFSWSVRTICITLGTRRRTALLSAITIDVSDFPASALAEDINFAWFLNVETKTSLAQIFVAKLALVRLVVPFCGFLIKSTSETNSGNGIHTATAGGKSILAATEELETIFSQWSDKHAMAFDPSFVVDPNDPNSSALFVQQCFLQLVNEYVVISTALLTVNSRLPLN